VASVLFVCTGNICRSPIAEGVFRDLMARADVNVDVSSAGIVGWEGSSAVEEAVRSAAECGSDISSHSARRLEASHVEAADLVVCMAGEHCDAVARLVPEAATRTFTLKELARLLEELPPPESGDSLMERIHAADALRRSGFEGQPVDEDVSDPIGMSMDTFRAVAWDIEEWCSRLVTGLVGARVAAADRES
jgi:protein-tyrosine-phosphatase